jgi:carboxyl-terminal processing protease
VRLRALALALAAGLLAAGAPTLPAQATSYEELQRFSAVLNHIRTNYVDSVTYNGLVRSAIDGMLRSLDPHSWFASAEDYAKLSAVERGELAVIGLRFETIDGVPVVLTSAAGGPAARGGVLPGDRIRGIDRQSVAGLSDQAITLLLAGEKGSRVSLLLERGPVLEPDTFTISVKRAFLRPPSAVSIARLVDAQTGYVKLEEFSEKSADAVADAIGRLKGQHARQVILDLRGNPGGIVTQAVELASEFLPSRTLVFSTRGRRKAVDADFLTSHSGRFTDLPLIVLIDAGSASAAEALAGSLQDHDRALILGRRSFGKALMQTGFIVPSGFVELTIGHVLTPSGRFIQRRYQGLAVKQYYASAGTAGAAEDTLRIYRTDHGREVRGGGGIAPDVVLPGPPGVPAWWSVAADSGFDEAVADSVAQTLRADPASRQAWTAGTDLWQTSVLPPFLQRVRGRLHVTAAPDAEVRSYIARQLAARAALVRWPPDGGEELMLRNDPDVAAALPYFARMAELLKLP